MSTRALIGKKNDDGTIDAIYLHRDGYPEHAHTVLGEHYASDTKADELLGFGDCLDLAPTVASSVFFSRDRGEAIADVKPQRLGGSAFLAAAFEYRHVYLWDGSEWKHWQPKR